MTYKSDLLTRKQAALLLGLTVHDLETKVFRQIGPNYYKVGKYCYYRKSELLSFSKKNRNKIKARL